MLLSWLHHGCRCDPWSSHQGRIASVSATVGVDQDHRCLVRISDLDFHPLAKFITSDTAHASINCEDDPEHELCEEEAHGDPETDVKGVHRVVGRVQGITDSCSIVLLQGINTVVDHFEVIKAIKVQLSISLGIASLIAEPRCPNQYRKTAWIVEEQSHDSEPVIDFLALNDEVNSNAHNDPESETDNKSDAHTPVEVVIDL